MRAKKIEPEKTLGLKNITEIETIIEMVEAGFPELHNDSDTLSGEKEYNEKIKHLKKELDGFLTDFIDSVLENEAHEPIPDESRD